jgi:hypothetical protein
MQTVKLKIDIIARVAELNDKRLINALHQWLISKEKEKTVTKGIIPPRRQGSLTEGYGFWADDAPFDETNYRDKLWDTEKTTW